jgi:hypothetical protein
MLLHKKKRNKNWVKSQIYVEETGAVHVKKYSHIFSYVYAVSVMKIITEAAELS